MRPENNIDLGVVQIHKRVIADICAVAISGVDGVRMFRFEGLECFLSFFGFRYNSAVDVVVDARGQVSVVVKVIVQFGINLGDISRRLQDVVMTAVEQMVNIDLKDVDVSIRGIERRLS